MNKFKGVLEHSGIFSKLVVLFAIVCFFFLILSPLSALITVSKTPNDTFLKLYQLFLSIGIFVLPPFVLAYLCSTKPSVYLHLDRRVNPWDAVSVVFLMLIIIPFVNLLGDLNHQLVLPKALAALENLIKVSQDRADKLVEQMLQVHGFYALLFNIFLIAVLPAVGEELFFRGAIIRIFQNWRGVKTAIWITAFIFSGIHFQFYGFVPRLLMGVFFGYLLLWNGNLWLPILAHFINNVVAVIFFYLKFNGYKLPDIDSIGIGSTLWIGIASGVAGLFAIFWLKRRFSLQKD